MQASLSILETTPQFLFYALRHRSPITCINSSINAHLRLVLKRLIPSSQIVIRGVKAAQPLYAPGSLGEQARSSPLPRRACFFTGPVGFRPRISPIAPDALSGETLSLARFVAKDLGETCRDFDTQGVGATAHSGSGQLDHYRNADLKTLRGISQRDQITRLAAMEVSVVLG